MTKFTFTTLLILNLLLVTGCNYFLTEKEEFQKETRNDVDIYDFYFINRAPAATEKHSLEGLIKIYFSAKNIAIDVKESEIYIEPLYSTNGIDTFEDPLPFDDKEGLIEILEKYRVQEWKEDYTTVHPNTYDDGYGWMMLLQFEDGTVERYKGSGPYKEDVIPGNFDDFADEIETFKKEKIKEGSS